MTMTWLAWVSVMISASIVCSYTDEKLMQALGSLLNDLDTKTTNIEAPVKSEENTLNSETNSETLYPEEDKGDDIEGGTLDDDIWQDSWSDVDEEAELRQLACVVQPDDNEILAEDENGRDTKESIDMRLRDSVEPFTAWGVDMDLLGSKHPMGYMRNGSASDKDTCDDVRNVPNELRNSFFKTIPRFYTKYTEAYGIPVLGSDDVTDVGLMRACYEIRFLLADRFDLRNAYYKMWGRVALIGDNEQQTSLPEYWSFNSDYWDGRARGLGPTVSIPTTSVGDDNMRCKGRERYPNQDILVHEFGHAVHLLSAQYVIPGFYVKVHKAYENAVAKGLWKNTYGGSNFREYWAMATQMYLNSYNGYEYRVYVEGTYKFMQDRDTLAKYDPTVKNLLDQLFPCQNTFVHRCAFKDCHIGRFEEVNTGSGNKKSSCRVVSSSFNKATVEECAEYACLRQGNAFNYFRTYCYALECDRGNMNLVSATHAHRVYTMVDPLVLDPTNELAVELKMDCAPRQILGPAGNDRCAEASATPCGDGTDRKASCKRRGCCWNRRKCVHPKQDCIDKALNCAGKAARGECVNSSIKERCPLSCGDENCK